MRPLRWCATAVGVALIAGGCTSAKSKALVDATPTFEFSGTAATVNGEDIPAQLIADQIEADKIPQVAQVALGDPDVLDAHTGQVKPTVVAALIETEIAVKLIEAELKVRGLTPTTEMRGAAEASVRGQFGDAIDKIPEAMIKQTIGRFANFIALDQALAPLPTDEEVRKVYDKAPTSYVRACVRHILVTDAAIASDTLAKLKAGGDFAALAKAVSQDPGSAVAGGDLGCVAKGSFVDAFEKATWEGAVGEIQGPIKTEFGLHIIQVTTRAPATFDDVKEEIRAKEAPENFQALGVFIRIRLSKATITIDPRYGTWDATGSSVRPKGAKSAADLTIVPPEGQRTQGTATTAGTGK